MQSPGGNGKGWQLPWSGRVVQLLLCRGGNEGALNPHALCTGKGAFAALSWHGMREKSTGLDEGGFIAGLVTMA